MTRRGVAAGIAAALVFTSVSEPFAQSTFWEQQRAARQSLYKQSNPEAAEARALLAGVTWPQEAVNPLLGSFRLSSRLGHITETHVAPVSEMAPEKIQPLTIYHLQDAHGLFGAQRNAAEILRGLARMNAEQGAAPAPLIVLQEGGTGAVETEWLSSYPFPEATREVASAYLRQGSLTGEEYGALIEGPARLRLVGAEKADLYRRNLQTRHGTVSERLQAARYMGGVQARLDAVKARSYPPALRELDARVRDYAEKRLTFVEYLRELARLSPAPLRADEYRNVHTTLLLARLEDGLDLRALAKERAHLVELMADHLSLDALRELVAKAAEMRLGHVNPRVFYQGLVSVGELLSRRGVDAPTGHLRQYVAYLDLVEKVSHDRLLAEAEQLKNRLFETYSGSDRLWRLISLDKRVDTEIALWRQELTPAEYAVYRQQGPLDWIELEKYLLAQEKALGLPSAPVSSEASLAAWGAKRPLIEQYYELALERDVVLAQAAVDELKKSGAAKGVLIAGGFHTPGMTRLLRQLGVNYAVIQPRFEASAPEGPRALQLSYFAPSADRHTVREPNRLPGEGFQRSFGLSVFAVDLPNQIERLLPKNASEDAPSAADVRRWLEKRGIEIYTTLETRLGQILVFGRAGEDDLALVFDPQGNQLSVYVGAEKVELARREGKLSTAQTSDLSDRLGEIVARRGVLALLQGAGLSLGRSYGRLNVDLDQLLEGSWKLVEASEKSLVPEGRRQFRDVAAGLAASVKNAPKAVKGGALRLMLAGAALTAVHFLTGGVSLFLWVSTAVSFGLWAISGRLSDTRRKQAALAFGGAMLLYAFWTLGLTAALPMIGVVAVSGYMIKRLFASRMPRWAKMSVAVGAMLFGFSSAASAATLIEGGAAYAVESRDTVWSSMAKRDLRDAGITDPSASQVHQRVIEYQTANPGLDLDRIEVGQRIARPDMSHWVDGRWTSTPPSADNAAAVTTTTDVDVSAADSVDLASFQGGDQGFNLANASFEMPSGGLSANPLAFGTSQIGGDATNTPLAFAHAGGIAALLSAAPLASAAVFGGVVLAGVVLGVFWSRRKKNAAAPNVVPQADEKKTPALPALLRGRNTFMPLDNFKRGQHLDMYEREMQRRSDIEYHDSAAGLSPDLVMTFADEAFPAGDKKRRVLVTSRDDRPAGLTRNRSRLVLNIPSHASPAALWDHVQHFNETGEILPVREAAPTDETNAAVETSVPTAGENRAETPVTPAPTPVVEDDGADEEPVFKTVPTDRPPVPLRTADGLINVNAADLDGLRAALAGIGLKTRGQRIVDARAGGPFADLNDLLARTRSASDKGFSAAVLKVADRLSFDQEPEETPAPVEEKAPVTAAAGDDEGTRTPPPVEEPLLLDEREDEVEEPVFKTPARAPPTPPRPPRDSGGPVNPEPPSGSDRRTLDGLVEKVVAFLKTGPRTFPGSLRPAAKIIGKQEPGVYATFGQHGVMGAYVAFPVIQKLAADRENADAAVRSLRKALATAKKQLKEAAAGEAFRRAQVPQINAEIASLEARLDRRRLEIQRGLLDYFESAIQARRGEIAAQGKGTPEGLGNMLDSFYQRLEFYRGRPIPVWFNEVPQGRLVKFAIGALSTAYVVALLGFAFSFSMTAGLITFGICLAIRYNIYNVAQKLVYLLAAPFIRTPGHKRLDFVQFVREQARLAGKPYRFDIKVPKLSTNKGDADAWFTYRRIDLESLRDTFRAVGDDFQVTFVMNSNTKLKEKEVLDYEVQSIRDIQAEVDADPDFKGRVKFIYMHQSMHWFDNGKPTREGWTKKVGSVMSSEWFLTQGHTRPPAYTDRNRFRHALNGEEAMFDRLEGDFIGYFGENGRVTFEVAEDGGGTRLVTVTDNEDFKRLVTDKKTLRITTKSEGPEFSITIDDKNSFSPGEVEKAIAIMAHPENRGIVIGNPRIEVDAPRLPNGGQPGEQVGSYWLDFMQQAREIHNSFTAVLSSAIHANASAMFGKFITRNTEYAQSFTNEYLQPDRILSHDWNESIFSPTEALYGDPHAKIRQHGRETVGGRDVYTFSVSTGEEVRMFQIAMEGAGKAGARAELFTQDEAGNFVSQRTFSFGRKMSRAEISRYVARFLTNTFTIYERDFLTFGSVIDRDLRWLRGDWQMWFTFAPYRDVLYPQAKMHLSGITRRFLGDASFLLQTLVFTSFFFMPFLMDVNNLWLAKVLLAVVLVTFAGLDNYFVPLWWSLKARFQVDVAVNKPWRLAGAVALAIGMFFLASGNFVVITLIALQALALRPIYVYKLLKTELTGRAAAWHTSSAQSGQELKGLSWWSSFSYLGVVFKIGLFLAIPVFLMLSMGNMFMSVLGPMGLGVFLTAYLFAPTLISHFAGKPYSREKRRLGGIFKRIVIVVVLAASIIPTFLVPISAWKLNRDIRAREPAAWVERLTQTLSQENLYQNGRFVPPYQLEFSANPAMQQTMTPPYRLPPLVSPFTTQDPLEIEMSMNPIPREAMPRALPDNITRTQMVSPFHIPLDDVQAVNLMHPLDVPNRQYLAAFINTVEDRFDSDRMTPRYLAAGGARTAVTAVVPGGGFIVKGYEVEAWIEANARSKAPWLNNPLIANYWIETSRLSGVPLADRDNPNTVTITKLFQWETIHRLWDAHKNDSTLSGAKINSSRYWEMYLLADGPRRASLNLGPAVLPAERYRTLARHFNDFKYEYLSTAVMSLHYGMGMPVEDITPEHVATFLIRAFELEEMWKAQLGNVVDVTAFELLPKGMKKFNRTLGTILFFVPIRIPVLSDLPMGLISTAELVTNRPGGAIETMTQLVLRNRLTPQQFMDIIGGRYIQNYYRSYFPNHRAGPSVDASLMALVDERIEREWHKARGGARSNEDFREYINSDPGKKARNIAYLQAEYMLGTTAVVNNARRLLGRSPSADQINQVASQLGVAPQTLRGILRGETVFADGDMAAIHTAARETAGYAGRVFALVNDGAHPRLRDYLLTEAGILEGEAVQMYLKSRRDFNLENYLGETKMVFDRAEQVVAQLPTRDENGVTRLGLNEAYVNAIFQQLPERIREYVRPQGKDFMALRSLAMLTITMERNGMQNVLQRDQLARLQTDYVDALTRLQAHPRIPYGQPGIVEYFVILRQQLFQLPEMRARWGEDEAAFAANFWQYFNARLDRVNKFLSELAQTNGAEQAFREGENWRTYETWVNEEISRASGAPVVSDQVRFYNALMTMTEMVLDLERKFSDQRDAPRAELMSKLAERHNRYRAVFQELNNAEWNSKEGFLESFVTAGYRIGDVDREVREVFFLREVNELWKDGASWNDISANRRDDFLRLVRMRMERDFRDLNMPQTDIDRLLGDESLLKFIALQTFHRLGHSALYNQSYDHQAGAPGRTSFTLDEIKAAGADVMGNFSEVYRRARDHAGLMGYFESEPGIIENEAVLLYLMNRQGQDTAAYLRDLETIFPAVDRLIAAGALTREHLQLPENDIRRRYIEEMFGRMRETVRGVVTDGGKVFNALRALATLQHTGEVNGIRLSPEQWMREYMGTLDQFRGKNYQKIPFMRSGIAEFFIMLKFKLGWDNQRFWDHFHVRLARVDAQMQDADFLRRAGRPDGRKQDESQLDAQQRAWRTYENRINEEIARTSGIDVRHDDVQLYNALMAVTEMVIDTENKFPEFRGGVDVLRLAERHEQYIALQGRFPNLPWSEKGFRESLVTSGYKLNNLDTEARMFLLEEINALMGTGVAERHPDRAALAAMVRAESIDPQISDRVINFLILQKVVSIGKTFNLTMNAETANRLMRDVARMERRVPELRNLQPVFQVKGEKEKWIGIGIAMGFADVDELFEQYLLPIDRNYQLARSMYVRSGDFNELAASLENANGVMSQDIGSYERNSGLPEGSIVRPRMTEEQMIVDRIFFDIQRLRSINMQFNLNDFLRRYYRNIQFLKGADFYGPQLRQAAADGAEDLGKLNGKIDNYAYTFALLDALTFAEGGSAEFRNGLNGRGLNNVEDVMRAFHGNLQFVQELPNMSAALQDLRTENEFVADGAAFSYALMLTLNERLPREELARLDRQFPNIFRDYQQFLGASPRIDSPVLLYEALQRDLGSLKIFGDRTDQLNVKTLRLNGNWLADAVIKETFRGLFQIYVDEEAGEEATPEDKQRAEAHAGLLRHYEELAKNQSMASILDQLVNAETIPDPNDPNPDVASRRQIPNPFKARLASIDQTIAQIRSEIAEARQKGFHAQANQLEERDLETWLNNRQSFVERMEFVTRMAAEFDKAEKDAIDEQYKVVTEMLLAMLLLSFALGAAGGAYQLARRRLAKGDDKKKFDPKFPVGALLALMALGVGPYAVTHWGDLKSLRAVENYRMLYGSDETRAALERAEVRQGEVVSPAQNRQLLQGLDALRHQSGILADNSTVAGLKRTKPTNIAMDLLVTLTARRQGLLNEEESRATDRRLARTLQILAQLKRDHAVDGIFPEFVRISPDGTLTPIRTDQGTIRYSSLDAGWLTMALAAVRDNYPADSEIARLATDLLAGQNYRTFLDAQGRLGAGFEVDASGRRVPSSAFNFSYTDLNSEARVVVLSLVGLGQLPESAYRGMELRWTEREGVRVAQGYHMSAFVALTGNVFFPEAELSSTWREAHRGYVRATFKQADRLGNATAGSAPAARSARLYKEYGLDDPSVVTPYAAALLTTLRNSPDSARAIENLQRIFALHGDRQPLPDALAPKDGAVLNAGSLGLDQALLILAVNRQGVLDMLGDAPWVLKAHELIRDRDPRRTTPPTIQPGGTNGTPNAPTTPTPRGTPLRRASLGGLNFGASEGGTLAAMLPMFLLGMSRGRRGDDEEEDGDGKGETPSGDGSGPKPLSPAAALRALQKELMLNQFGIPSTKTSRRFSPMTLQRRRMFLAALNPTGARAKAWADGRVVSVLASKSRFLAAVRAILRDDYGIDLAVDQELSRVFEIYSEEALFGELKVGYTEGGGIGSALEPGFLLNIVRPFHKGKAPLPVRPTKMIVQARADRPAGVRTEPTADGEALVLNLEGVRIGRTNFVVPVAKYETGADGRQKAVPDGVKTIPVQHGHEEASAARKTILELRTPGRAETPAAVVAEGEKINETAVEAQNASEPVDEKPSGLVPATISLSAGKPASGGKEESRPATTTVSTEDGSAGDAVSPVATIQTPRRRFRLMPAFAFLLLTAFFIALPSSMKLDSASSETPKTAATTVSAPATTESSDEGSLIGASLEKNRLPWLGFLDGYSGTGAGQRPFSVVPETSAPVDSAWNWSNFRLMASNSLERLRGLVGFQVRNDDYGLGTFRSPRDNRRGWHTGTDIESPHANTPVLAFTDMEVIEVGVDRDRRGRVVGAGYHARLRSKADGAEYSYFHMHPSLLRTLRAGQTVKKGERIGLSDKTGNADDPGIVEHVHFEVRLPVKNSRGRVTGTRLVNPENYLAQSGFTPNDFFDLSGAIRQIVADQTVVARIVPTTGEGVEVPQLPGVKIESSGLVTYDDPATEIDETQPTVRTISAATTTEAPRITPSARSVSSPAMPWGIGVALAALFGVIVAWLATLYQDRLRRRIAAAEDTTDLADETAEASVLAAAVKDVLGGDKSPEPASAPRGGFGRLAAASAGMILAVFVAALLLLPAKQLEAESLTNSTAVQTRFTPVSFQPATLTRDANVALSNLSTTDGAFTLPTPPLATTTPLRTDSVNVPTNDGAAVEDTFDYEGTSSSDARGDKRPYAALVYPAIDKALKKHPGARGLLTADLVYAVMGGESSFVRTARSDAGANGLMQVLGGSMNPRANIDEGVRRLAEYVSLFNNGRRTPREALELGLAAYNAGPGDGTFGRFMRKIGGRLIPGGRNERRGVRDWIAFYGLPADCTLGDLLAAEHAGGRDRGVVPEETEAYVPKILAALTGRTRAAELTLITSNRRSAPQQPVTVVAADNTIQNPPVPLASPTPSVTATPTPTPSASPSPTPKAGEETEISRLTRTAEGSETGNTYAAGMMAPVGAMGLLGALWGYLLSLLAAGLKRFARTAVWGTNLAAYLTERGLLHTPTGGALLSVRGMGWLVRFSRSLLSAHADAATDGAVKAADGETKDLAPASTQIMSGAMRALFDKVRQNGLFVNPMLPPGSGQSVFVDARDSGVVEAGEFRLNAGVGLALFQQLVALQQRAGEGETVQIDVVVSLDELGDSFGERQLARVFEDLVERAKGTAPDLSNDALSRVKFNIINVAGADAASQSARLRAAVVDRIKEGRNVQVITDGSESSVSFWSGMDIPALVILAAQLVFDAAARLHVDVVYSGKAARALEGWIRELDGGEDLLKGLKDGRGNLILKAQEAPTVHGIGEDVKKITLFNIQA